MQMAPISMKHLCRLMGFTLFLPGAARRSIRIGDSFHDAHQKITIAKTVEVSADTWMALLPRGFGTAPLRHQGPPAGALHSADGQGFRLRTPHGQPLSMRNGMPFAWRRPPKLSRHRSDIPVRENPLPEEYGQGAGYLQPHRAAPPIRIGPRRATVALHAANGPEEETAGGALGRDLRTVLGQQPADVSELLQLSSALLQVQAGPLALAQLTDAIDYPIKRPSDNVDSALAKIARSLKRLRRSQLLVDLLKKNRTEYVETVSFLSIPRAELPNRQDIPLRECDSDLLSQAGAAVPETVVTADDLVGDCMLREKEMGENLAEAWILEITRNIYSEETGVPRNTESGIVGLIDEMRRYMFSPEGMTPASQQEVLIRTLRKLMTPFLPPFYRIFMGGIVPSYDPNDKRIGRDPKWLADGVQWVRNKLPVALGLQEYLEPGRQLGPWFYAPTLTAIVAPYAFGFLVGPSKLNFRSDGELGGLVVEKCKFLQESNCKSMCLNSCKLPAQQLFQELGLDLRVSPNFETQECQWSFGEEAPPPEEDPTWPKGCIVGCTSREAMKELKRVCE